MNGLWHPKTQLRERHSLVLLEESSYSWCSVPGRVLRRNTLLLQAACGFTWYHSSPGCIFNILKEVAYWASHVYLVWYLESQPRISYIYWLSLDSCYRVLAQSWVSFPVGNMLPAVIPNFAPLSSPPSLFAFHIKYAYFPIGILVSFCGQEMGLTTLSELNLGFISIFFSSNQGCHSILKTCVCFSVLIVRKPSNSLCVLTVHTPGKELSDATLLFMIFPGKRKQKFDEFLNIPNSLGEFALYPLCGTSVFLLAIFHISFQVSAMARFILNRLRIKLMADLTHLVLARI